MVELKNKLKPCEIFLIEDNKDDVFLISLAIKECQINGNIQTANNGKTAIDILKEKVKSNKKLPDLIILDINLPRITGLEVLKEIKLEESTSFIPTVVFTSSDSTSDMNYSYKNGADLFIKKPNNINDFKKIMSYIKAQFLEN